MAVDARQLRVSPSLMIQPKREFIHTHMDPSVANGQELMSSLQQSVVYDPVSATTLMNSISDITCNNVLASGQRLCTDSYKDFNFNSSSAFFKGSKFSSIPQCFLDEVAIHQIQTQQSEIDQLIAHHAEGIRLELDRRRKEQSRMFLSYINQRVMKKLKEKDEEIAKMRKLNWVLEERAKNLSMENQLWRDLAQTNEATANSLRSNLEQALALASQEHNYKNNGGGAIAEDVESCCGSTDYSRTRCMVGNSSSVGMCRRCGVEESRVLLLPCRHLCLCALCASSVYTCPICNSIMDGNVHVNTLHQILPR